MPQHAPSPFSLEGLMKQIGDQKYPPVDKWNPDFCGDINMCIKSDGTWFYMGTPIGRARMVKLFASVLRKDDDGKTYLVTPVEKIGITVEDAPFVATTLNVVEEGGQQLLVFETNVGDKIVAGEDNPIRVETNNKTGEPRPYIRVRGKLEALIARSVFYQMVELATQQGDELVINSGDVSFSLGTLDEC
jgi:uncharacterized protein